MRYGGGERFALVRLRAQRLQRRPTSAARVAATKSAIGWRWAISGMRSAQASRERRAASRCRLTDSAVGSSRMARANSSAVGRGDSVLGDGGVNYGDVNRGDGL